METIPVQVTVTFHFDAEYAVFHYGEIEVTKALKNKVRRMMQNACVEALDAEVREGEFFAFGDDTPVTLCNYTLE